MRSNGEVAFRSIAALSQAIDAGTLDPRELADLMFDRIAALNPTLNLYLSLCRDTALAEVEAATDRTGRRCRRGPLDGIPIAVKDNIDVAGVPTSNGLGGTPWRVPCEDAEIVRRLRAAGAVVLGKLNMHEAALGGSTDNPHFGAAINPYRAGYSPGGSSGGSGAAVAAGLCVAALGTDTGGSVRIPASYCGVVGFKPSFGLVSTRGVVPLSWRLDHIGPLTRSVDDARLMFVALHGFDPRCPESRCDAVLGGDVATPLGGLRLGVWELADEPADPAVATAFAAALGVFAELGCAIRPVALSGYDSLRARRAALLRIEADAAFIHADLYAREPARFSPALRAGLDYGATVSTMRLVGADRVIAMAGSALARVFDEVDAIVSPTTPQSAFPFAEGAPDNQNAYCVAANFAGAPAISVPMGHTRDGLPLGLQIIAACDHDLTALRLADAYEAACGLNLRPPPLYGP
ncbi:MAG TPA: amidase [Stellaceae bacterium]|jgi:aspartyl-tRNA(Asn)/glutamyl-tRNA(Gln) amidotransferase subunit A|nr:amidase [Stellaceae bacterium]